MRFAHDLCPSLRLHVCVLRHCALRLSRAPSIKFRRLAQNVRPGFCPGSKICCGAVATWASWPSSRHSFECGLRVSQFEGVQRDMHALIIKDHLCRCGIAGGWRRMCPSAAGSPTPVRVRPFHFHLFQFTFLPARGAERTQCACAHGCS